MRPVADDPTRGAGSPAGGSIASDAASAASLLAIEDVAVHFSGVTALDGVSFSVPEGQVCAVIGPNGAGKTTLFNVITGLYEPSGGSIRFDGQELLGVPRDKRAQRGISRTFQNIALFRGLSVLDNVLVGAYSRSSGGFIGTALRLPGARASERSTRERCRSILSRLGIDHLAAEHVQGLPFGTLKRVELARALAAEPRLLLLDEPASGLTHGEVDALVGLLREVRDDASLTLIVVEHHMRLVNTLCDRVVALNLARIIADDVPARVARDPKVVEAYLGRAA